MAKGQPCMRTGCRGDSHTRGLCRACYQTARLLVLEGCTTWEQLEKLGRARPCIAPQESPRARFFLRGE